MLQEKLQMETRGKQSEYGSLEKKLQDTQENEKRLLLEIDELKIERGTYIVMCKHFCRQENPGPVEALREGEGNLQDEVVRVRVEGKGGRAEESLDDV